MRLSTTLALAAIFGATTLPMIASAQSRSDNGKWGSNKQDKDKDKKDSDSRRGQNNGNDRSDRNRDRDNDKWRSDSRHDQRRDKDRSDWNKDRNNDRWRSDSRHDQRYGNDRFDWDRNDRNHWDNSRFDNRNNDWRNERDHRQDTKNEWRNIAIGSGALSILGLLKGDNTLFFGGAAGALYSIARYEHDRKSQNAVDRARYSYFSHDYFYRDNDRFDRKVVNKNGQRYYQFVRQGR
jgi:hypothetical protein